MDNEKKIDITLTDVTKVFQLGLWKKKTAVSQVTFAVPRGEIVGLLGPNGSGKSTIMKMILGFLRPTHGEILICGYTPQQQISRSLIGYLPENPRFQKFLSAREVLRYYGRLVGLEGQALRSRIDELLTLVNLKAAADERNQGYSKGMIQRLAVAQALLAQPRILIFDEPMSGLDPLGRMEIRELIQRIKEEMPSTTMFLSTHILSDVERLCASVILLHRGKLKRYCSIQELMLEDTNRFDLVVRELPPPLEKRYKEEQTIHPSPLGFSMVVEGTDELIQVLTELRKFGAKVVGVFSQRTSLEEALFREVNQAEQREKESLKEAM